MPRLEDEQSFEIADNAPSAGGSESAAAPNGKLIGRAQAARLLGVSKSTLRRMEGDALTPVVGPKNVRLFHEEQIQSMVVTRRSEIGASTRVTGDIAATVFELFDDSMHPVDVVKRLRLEPDLIEGLHQRWRRLRGMLVLSEESTATVHRMLGEGDESPPPKDEAELVSLVQRWVRDESCRQCEQCRSESAEFCRTCAKAWGLRAARNEIAHRRSRQL
jgi:hypothetical protein